MKDPRHSWNQTATAPAKAKPASYSRQSKSPRWTMLNAFVDHRMRHLSRAASDVWLVLYRETNRQGLSRITIEQIAEKVGVGTTSVKAGLRELRTLKMVVQVSRGSRNKGPSIYRLLPVSIVAPPTTEHTISTVAPPAVEAGKRASSTVGQATTATVGQATTPQKEQEHRRPLGASAVQLNGEEEVRTLRITA